MGERPPHDKSAYLVTRYNKEDLALPSRINQEDYLKGLLLETLYVLYHAHKKANVSWLSLADSDILDIKSTLFNARSRLIEVLISIYKLLNEDQNISLIIAHIDNILSGITNRNEDDVQDVMAYIVNTYITREMILRYNMRNSHGKKHNRKNRTIRKNRKNKTIRKNRKNKTIRKKN